MNQPSDVLKSLLFDMRQHPAWPELLEYLKPNASIPRYSPKDGEDVEKSRSTWIYRSGLWGHYEVVLSKLTGKPQSLKGDE